MFRKVLIANRGEIAVRVAATCQALGITAAVVYSEADTHALHVRVADEAYPIGPAPATASYLNVEAIIAAALRAGADALHPGYGFLSENPALADACREAGIIFIGPTAEAMRLLGSKSAAKRLAAQAQVPTVPGYHGHDQDDATLAEQARALGVPLLIKAAAGGGGRGMRELHDLADFADALAAARREALAAFGDDAVLLERLVESPRHVEFQIVGDHHGHVVHLGERECSVQRRHQKIVEEAPSPAVDDALRAEMGAAAVRVARAAGYTNAGTAEFMLAPDGAYYFLEMNARLQVEHPVTEYVTGLDLVALQLRIAAGEPLPFTQDQIALRGHAVECRLYAEDPAAGFLPSTGRLAAFDLPAGPGIRLDAGVEAGDEVTVHYDPMLAKLVAGGETRREALDRALWSLRRSSVLGVTTNLAFLERTLAHPAFAAGELSTAFVTGHLSDAAAPVPPSVPALLLAAFWQVRAGATESAAPRLAEVNGPTDPWLSGAGWSLSGGRTITLAWGDARYQIAIERLGASRWSVAVGDERAEVSFAARDGTSGLALRLDGAAGTGGTQRAETQRVLRGHVVPRDGSLLVGYAGGSWTLQVVGPPDVDAAAGHHGTGGGAGALTAPMPGTIIAVHVREGDRVEAGQRLMVLEAMKMEHAITAPYGGTVRAVLHREGDIVASGARLADLAEE